MLFRCPSCGAFNRVPENHPPGQPDCGRCHQAVPLTGEPQDVNAAALAQAIAAAPIPVVVDFWAPWCQPCRTAAPILEQVGKARAGRVLVLKLNTENEPQAGAQHGVRGIPTFALFSGGREVGRLSGVRPKDALLQWIDSSAGQQGAAAQP